MGKKELKQEDIIQALKEVHAEGKQPSKRTLKQKGNDSPDCEAKRYVEGRGKQQQSVKIGFEFRSRDYDHPLEGCDIIVCWEDNWGSDCPLEVIELRSEIKQLRESPEFTAIKM